RAREAGLLRVDRSQPPLPRGGGAGSIPELSRDPMLLRLVDADFGYGSVPIVHRICAEIVPGEFVALLGANGSGKTTLVRGLIGLIPRVGGRIERSRALRIGYVPQRESLDPLYPLSGFDVAMLGACRDLPFYRRAGAAVRENARAALSSTRAVD